MAEYTFFFNPMSRAQIARWALHEAGADYEPVFVAWDNKPAALLAANPLGKLPTIIHHHGGHDHVVSEAAAVCHYIAEVSARELLPDAHEKAAGDGRKRDEAFLQLDALFTERQKEVRARVGIDDGLKRRLGLVHGERGRRVHAVGSRGTKEVADDRDVRVEYLRACRATVHG